MSRTSNDVSILADFKAFSRDFPVSHLVWVQEYQPDNELHYHNCLEIGYVMQGSGREMIGNQLYSFEPNTLSIIPQSCIHDSHINMKSMEEPGSTWKFIFVCPEKLKINYEDFAGYISNDTNLLALFHMMYDELENQPQNYQETFHSLLSCFLVYAKRNAPQNNTASNYDLPFEIAKAIQRIHSSYNENLSIPQLAAECNMSLSSFNRAFKQFFNIPPLTYINNIRLSVAQHMLQNTNLPILTISTSVGFHSLSSFNRLYKKKYDTSPSNTRRQFKQQSAHPDLLS